MIRKLPKLNALQTLALGFVIIIMIGTMLLMLPIASQNRESLAFLDSLFTATSATCVTGLVVFDTYTQFSFFGQFVILILIQIGGLGFMTIAVLFSIIIGKRIGLKERINLMQSVNSPQVGGVVRLARRILIVTAICELVGAGLLSIRFIPEFGVGKGIWFSVFHAISAFCNSGFDLMGTIAPNVSLMPFATDPLVVIVILFLIVIGGLGFIVWNDIADHGLHFSNYRLHTKILLVFTGIIILTSTGLFLVFERQHTLVGYNPGEQLLLSLFSAITPRTAGFNTVQTASLSEAGSGLTMLLMLIGAGPGSTAGGIKITTLVVIFFSIVAHVRGKEDINLFGRRLEDSIIRKSFSSAAMYLLMLLTGVMTLFALQDVAFLDGLFEGISAIGTVGLSRGITASLSNPSQVVMILLMYVGRVGSLAVAMAFVEHKTVAGLRNPVEKIIIG
ncbi:MAG: TrkH family potassium uptake protein [Candidatus Izemoplasmatales bacterium]|jgi:trk system potassium uptake protein TrkH|nr:TrkH family potassium uptake protein [Candidatus Izemoplasmatales bacterium]MDY0372656.1 TrkH family potassium uptake protein [Candidatus Izemoplasmatales bacterium]